MAKGSEQFSWKLYGLPSTGKHPEKVCRECGKHLRVEDVAEERHLIPSNKYDFLCKECRASRLETAVARNRSRLSLPVQDEPRL